MNHSRNRRERAQFEAHRLASVVAAIVTSLAGITLATVLIGG